MSSASQPTDQPQPNSKTTATAPPARLRLGCDPLHRHLLPEQATVHVAWRRTQGWSDQIRSGQLDAVLISIAGLTVDTLDHASQQVDPTPDAAFPQASVLAASGITAVALGSLPLVLLHSNCHRRRAEQCSRQRGWTLLLPAVEQQPRLWRELERLALLPLQACQAADSDSWLAQLRTAALLLPADFSLLQSRPWRDAGLRAVRSPDPLAESLWLLHRQNNTQLTPPLPLVQLIAHLRRRILDLQVFQP